MWMQLFRRRVWRSGQGRIWSLLLSSFFLHRVTYTRVNFYYHFRLTIAKNGPLCVNCIQPKAIVLFIICTFHELCNVMHKITKSIHRWRCIKKWLLTQFFANTIRWNAAEKLSSSFGTNMNPPGLSSFTLFVTVFCNKFWN